jgi:DNA (cytosine-5)-methyltransferase 1
LKTCFSLFSGCGGADEGLRQAGYRSLGGIELDGRFADIYDLNHEVPATRADVLGVDRIPTADLLWVSPPCPSFSAGNLKAGGEKDADRKLAVHIAKLAIESNTRTIAIENVPAYLNSGAYGILSAALIDAGYWIEANIQCTADYGAPTTRRRAIVLAVKEGNPSTIALTKTHRKPGLKWEQSLSREDGRWHWGCRDLPPWQSWWEAIADRLPELPVSRLTEIQSQRLGLCPPPETCLIERCGYYHGRPKIYPPNVPAPTIRSAQHSDGRGSYRVALNVVRDSTAYTADIRCLADWQGFPRSYQFGDNRAIAGRTIGNAVPPPLAVAVGRAFAAT